MSFTLLCFEVESRGQKAKRLATAMGQPLSTFGSFAALGLHSCRALSSAHCTKNLNQPIDNGKFQPKGSAVVTFAQKQNAL
jgi:hypothetical protein